MTAEGADEEPEEIDEASRRDEHRSQLTLGSRSLREHVFDPADAPSAVVDERAPVEQFQPKGVRFWRIAMGHDLLLFLRVAPGMRPMK